MGFDISEGGGGGGESRERSFTTAASLLFPPFSFPSFLQSASKEATRREVTGIYL